VEILNPFSILCGIWAQIEIWPMSISFSKHRKTLWILCKSSLSMPLANTW